MKILVTGAAGFIGSHLTARLMAENHDVTGIDAFTDYYPRSIKENNLRPLLGSSNFTFVEADLNDVDLIGLLEDVTVIFHLAAQAGVRASWGTQFSVYTRLNIDATQRLLEAVKDAGLQKFVYASSSSVYGRCPELPMRESSPLLPFSPYGVTKLAAEHLCQLYHQNFGVPAVSLRFFTVFGPGQRPDMAFHRFFRAIAEGQEVTIYGDGRQTRDFTYVDDIVEANLAAMLDGRDGQVYNIGGGHQRDLAGILPLLEEITQKPVRFRHDPSQKGDVLHTYASIERAERDLNYAPKVSLGDGLKAQWKWMQKNPS